jgi:membrane associated rhomboid family serine protease
MGLMDELRQQWRTGGALIRLVLVNALVFVALLLMHLVLIPIAGDRMIAEVWSEVYVMHWLQSTYVWGDVLFRPWTVITYMFVHLDFFHVFFNMLMLWLSGRLFMDLLGGKRLVGNYLLGGLAGWLFYALAYNYIPGIRGQGDGSDILGASASVMAVFIGIAAYRPDMVVSLLIFGEVRLKWIALIYLVLDLVSIRQGNNSGGHLAHVGGALYGYLAATQLKKGSDWSGAFMDQLQRIGSLFTRRKGPRLRLEKMDHRKVRVLQDSDFNATKRAKEERVNAILDKISRSGYDSLSKEEKDFLFRASHEQ